MGFAPRESSGVDKNTLITIAIIAGVAFGSTFAANYLVGHPLVTTTYTFTIKDTLTSYAVTLFPTATINATITKSIPINSTIMVTDTTVTTQTSVVTSTTVTATYTTTVVTTT